MKTTNPFARTIGLPVKREVRRRCGFGCVLCGLPLYEYHHIDEYAVLKATSPHPTHDPSRITLLCDRHHREATNNLFTPEQVERANNTPFNLTQGVSSPYGLHFEGTAFKAVVGDNTLEALPQGVTHLLMIDGISILSVAIDESGGLLLTMKVYDLGNSPRLTIVDNEIVYCISSWDVQFVGRTLTINDAPRHIGFEITFNPPESIRIARGYFALNGITISIAPDGIWSPQLHIGNVRIIDCDVCLACGTPPPSDSIGVIGVVADCFARLDKSDRRKVRREWKKILVDLL